LWQHRQCCIGTEKVLTSSRLAALTSDKHTHKLPIAVRLSPFKTDHALVFRFTGRYRQRRWCGGGIQPVTNRAAKMLVVSVLCQPLSHTIFLVPFCSAGRYVQQR
jgi:hypothetical protein